MYVTTCTVQHSIVHVHVHVHVQFVHVHVQIVHERILLYCFSSISLLSLLTGTNKKAPVDSLELAECVYKTLWLIKRIFSSRQSSMHQYQDIIASCRECFTSCFHAFYPSALLKWFALCTLLQQIDPVRKGEERRERETEERIKRNKGETRGKIMGLV